MNSHKTHKRLPPTDPDDLPDETVGPPHRKRRILRTTAALPALFTLGNVLAGFASIHFSTKDALGQATLGHLNLACLLILVAMVCDMLDGRVARLTRKTSEFGAQLDSLADIVSFGTAPAMLMLRTVIMVLHGQVDRLTLLPDSMGLERSIWCVAGVYLACAALRLARFNVETDESESSHMVFRGLPSPGAAAAVTTLVLLFAHLAGIERGWRAQPWLLGTVSVTLVAVTLAAALLMVSNFPYPHLVNRYVRGRKPFGFLVRLVLVALAVLLEPFVAAAGFALVYLLWGPVAALRRGRPGVTSERPSA